MVLTFDWDLDAGAVLEAPTVSFADTLSLPCASSAIGCSVAGASLTVTVLSSFSVPRDLAVQTVVDVSGLEDASLRPVVVSAPVPIGVVAAAGLVSAEVSALGPVLATVPSA